jgi:MacB-like periplasmic core domain/FtsX-like permease family
VRHVWRVAWFRFRSTFGRRWGGYFAIVLLIGLVGGLAMGAVAGARRTQSSYPAFLASTNPSDLSLPDALYGLAGAEVGYDPAIIEKIARLPHVKHVESSAELNNSPLQANGADFIPSGPNINAGTDGSLDGLYIDQDRITITSGRMVDARRPDETVVSAAVARALRAHIGSVIHLGFYTNAQEAGPGPSGSYSRPHPHLRIDMKLVGIGVLNNAIVQDDVDATGSNFELFTPALTRRIVTCCAQVTHSGLQLDHGSRDVASVEAELSRLNPLLANFYVTSIDEAKTERAIKPESIALGVFGLIAALAALLIASQVIGRELRVGADDLDIMRALGAGPTMTAGDGLIGVASAVLIGALVAAGVAVGLSPLFPIGPVRPVYPSRGIAIDWTVLGVGVVVLIVVLSALAVAFAYRDAPHRVARRSKLVAPRSSRVARAAAASGLPASAVTGVRFALEPGRGRNAVPVRSAILGAALAMVVVVSTLTFGASLRSLVSRPALYGWNWDYELSGGGGVGAIPQQESATALDHDRDVAAWTGVYFGVGQLDGHAVPVIAGSPNARVGPPLLSGHAFDAPDQVVLGATTLTELHKNVGDTVIASGLSTKPVRLRIVGTATMPTVGGSGTSLHAEMGTGALLSYKLIPASSRNELGNRPTGPNAIFVRFRPGVNRPGALRALNRIANKLSLPTNYGVEVRSVQRPAEIVNYRSMTTTPIYLGATLAVAAISALALTLMTSVRRRQRDLALLKTLGFTRRQLAAAVAWQSTIAVSIGTIVGVPVGIVVGRALWDLFAGEIHAVPRPSVPTLTITLVALGAVLVANLVAAIPGRRAARTPSALLLQAE